MIEFGIDEFTIVLQLPRDERKSLELMKWQETAEGIIDTFKAAAKFQRVFGWKTPEKRPPEGYTNAYTFGENDFYLAMAYHPYQPNMGVIVKFSARSLDYYCNATQLKPYQLLQKVNDPSLYELRLSRVDLTADFMDEDINPTTIYHDLTINRVSVFREYENRKTQETCYKKVPIDYRGIAKGNEVPTVYIGSPKSNSRLRIYDKRREQLETKGAKLDKAKACKSWVRFEGVFRHEYAHQITEALLNVNNDDEFANLIACTLVQKYRLMYVTDGVVDGDTEYTQMLMDCIANGNFTLRSPTSRSYEMTKSLVYLFQGSGIVSTLYKIKEVWGEDALAEMMEFIAGYVDEWTPNADCKSWLKKNKKAYQMNTPVFKDFLNAALSGSLV